jgi:hypothetical protein
MGKKPAEKPAPAPRWPALIAMVAIGGVYASLPESLAVGPRWLLPAILAVLTVPLVVAHRRGYHRLNIGVGHAVSAILTVFLAWSLALLVMALPSHTEPPVSLLKSAAALWLTNVLVFALWYWRLDAGGPHARSQRDGHETGAFLFPQMTLDGPAGCEQDGRPWVPGFVDYLFLAFNTSTAFSPTDTAALSRWAKVLMMAQSAISLSVVVILAGRAVNIL